jgi:hypothetical protein
VAVTTAREHRESLLVQNKSQVAQNQACWNASSYPSQPTSTHNTTSHCHEHQQTDLHDTPQQLTQEHNSNQTRECSAVLQDGGGN